MRNRNALMAGLLAHVVMAEAASRPSAVELHRQLDVADVSLKLLSSSGSSASPNGGRRHTVAQAKRAAAKRRNQIRHKAHSR